MHVQLKQAASQMEHKPCCDRRTWFLHEKCLSLKLSKWLWVSRRPTPAPALQLSPARLWVSSWCWDLSGDTADTKIYHQMLKYSTGPHSWWIIRQSPNLHMWGGSLCGYRLCTKNWLTPWWKLAHTSASDTSSPPLPISWLHFHTSWQG